MLLDLLTAKLSLERDQWGLRSEEVENEGDYI